MKKQTIIQKLKGLYSNYRYWCTYKKIPYIILPALSVLFLGIVFILIGGKIAGWNILQSLTSKTAVLVYSLILIAAIVFIFNTISKNFKRW